MKRARLHGGAARAFARAGPEIPPRSPPSESRRPTRMMIPTPEPLRRTVRSPPGPPVPQRVYLGAWAADSDVGLSLPRLSLSPSLRRVLHPSRVHFIPVLYIREPDSPPWHKPPTPCPIRPPGPPPKLPRPRPPLPARHLERFSPRTCGAKRRNEDVGGGMRMSLRRRRRKGRSLEQ